MYTRTRFGATPSLTGPPLPTMLLRALLICAGLACAFGAASASTTNHTAATAFQYRWTDHQGGIHFSDSLPLDAGSLGYTVINSSGLVVATVPPALTPSQKIAAQAELVAKNKAKLKAIADASADQALLSAYPTSQSLATAQASYRHEMEGNIKTLTRQIAIRQGVFAMLLQHADEVSHATHGHKLPPPLLKNIQAQRTQLSDLESQLARLLLERKDLLVRQSAQTARWNALQSKK